MLRHLLLVGLTACGTGRPPPAAPRATPVAGEPEPAPAPESEPAPTPAAPVAIGVRLPTAAQDAACNPNGKRVEDLDVNGDGKNDQRKLFVPGPAGELLVCWSVDFDGDGRPERIAGYDGKGSVAFEIFDFDFDGTPDASHFYLGAEHQLIASDTDHDGMVDLLSHEEDRVLLDLERDRNGDGKTDLWERHEDGQLVETRYDDDFDGQVDRTEP
jgi:hypothetical protein